MLSAMIAMKLEDEYCVPVIDMGLLLKSAIFHDFDESFIGDIARPVKHQSEHLKSLIKLIEENFIREFDSDNEYNGILFETWKNSKENTHGILVEICDIISVLVKLEDEICRKGNLDLYDCLSKNIIRSIFRKIDDLNELLKNEHGSFSDFLLDLKIQCEALFIKINLKVKGDSDEN
jgi:5'-deoxynucleotidase YfbR-like HD superfamily hydrolase